MGGTPGCGKYGGGLLVIPAGEGDVLRMVPPLVVSEAEVAEAVGTLRECFQEWR